MDPRFGCLILFLHLLILLGIQKSVAARVLDNDNLSKISNGHHKDTNLLQLHAMDVVVQENDRSSNVELNDVNHDAVDNQFWIYDKKDDAGDDQFWIYNKKNDASNNKKNGAVDNQVWIYDKKNGAAGDDQFWIYNKKNDASNNKKNGAVDNQVWIYDKKNGAVDNQVWLYDKRNVDNQEMARTRPTSSHIDHMDPTVLGFFNLEDLKLDKTMFTKFPKTDPKSSLLSLPKEKADTIPFSSKKFPRLLQFFPFPQESPQAKAMENTLRKCEAKPIKGETKFCATSYESMLNFARGTFGLRTKIKVLSTIHLTRSTAVVQKYTVVKAPERISAPKMLACHTMPYPYTVFYCHYQESESRIYKVSLNGENGDRVEAIAVCHMDTSHWSPDHISFRVLGIEPGTSPVCHFFASNHLVVVPSASV